VSTIADKRRPGRPAGLAVRTRNADAKGEVVMPEPEHVREISAQPPLELQERIGLGCSLTRRARNHD
jgi:hypothetical protein